MSPLRIGAMRVGIIVSPPTHLTPSPRGRQHDLLRREDGVAEMEWPRDQAWISTGSANLPVR